MMHVEGPFQSALCEDVGHVVFGLDIVYNDILACVGITNRVILDVHKAQTLECHLSTCGNSDCCSVVAPDKWMPVVETKLFFNGGEPENMVGGPEHGDVL